MEVESVLLLKDIFEAEHFDAGRSYDGEFGMIPCKALAAYPIAITYNRVLLMPRNTWKYLPQTRQAYTLIGLSDTEQHFSKSKSRFCSANQIGFAFKVQEVWQRRTELS